ncbi:hypothetical protein EIP86_006563 [Pleurotus ostreatoroseus]|nr:hypothetical protein EIP86_006563 [Pleurotus ostreatoroseus]
MASFARAVNAIKACEHPITSPDDLRKGREYLQGFWHTCQEKTTMSPNAHISAKDKVPMEEKYEPTLEEMRAMQILTTVPGIGKMKAMRLLKAGCRSLQQLLEPTFYDALNKQQQLGVKYYDEISKPVAREEAEALETFVRENLNSKWEAILVGS